MSWGRKMRGQALYTGAGRALPGFASSSFWVWGARRGSPFPRSRRVAWMFASLLKLLSVRP